MVLLRYVHLALRYVRLAVGVGTVFWVNPADCLAAEKLWLNAARASITSSELHSHVSLLADDMLEGREAGSRGGRAAAKYLIGRLEAAELLPAGTHGHYKQPFLHNHQNLLAILPGTDPDLRHEYIIVGAHYDHVGYGSRRNSYGPWGYIHNGADDNASGVAAVLEVIDALSHTDHRPRRSILFAFWDGEEKGLLGSKHWKNNPTVTFADVKLAINVDMVGRLTAGRIEVGGTRTAVGSRRMLSTARLRDGLWLDFNWEFKDNSDHWTFFEAGIPSLYLHTGLHDDYHRPSDDVEKLNIDGIRAVSGYLLEQVSQLADAEVLPTFRSVARQETPATQQRLEMPLPPASGPSRLGLSWRADAAEPRAVFITRVVPNSPASLAGIDLHDRLYQFNGQDISGADELLVNVRHLLDKGEKQLWFQVESRGVIRDVTVSLEQPESPKPDATL